MLVGGFTNLALFSFFADIVAESDDALNLFHVDTTFAYGNITGNDCLHPIAISKFVQHLGEVARGEKHFQVQKSKLIIPSCSFTFLSFYLILSPAITFLLISCFQIRLDDVELRSLSGGSSTPHHRTTADYEFLQFALKSKSILRYVRA